MSGPRTADLLDEEVAELLEQHREPPWAAVGLAGGPDQTDHVQQGPQPWLHLRKLQALEELQVAGEWCQVRVDVPCLCQSWKALKIVTFRAWGSHPPRGAQEPGTEGSARQRLEFLDS